MKTKQWKKIGSLIAGMVIVTVFSGCQTSGAHPFTTMFEKKDPHLEVSQAAHEFTLPATGSLTATTPTEVVTAMHEFAHSESPMNRQIH